jgi:hypothetical protein
MTVAAVPSTVRRLLTCVIPLISGLSYDKSIFVVPDDIARVINARRELATPRAILFKTLVSEYHTVFSLHVPARRAVGQLSQIPMEAAFKRTFSPPRTRLRFTDDISEASNESTSEALATPKPTVILTIPVRNRPLLTIQ